VEKKVIIYTPLPKAKRIKVFIPYHMKDARGRLKSVKGCFWHSSQKLWSVPNTDSTMRHLQKMFEGFYVLKPCEKPCPVKTRKLSEKAENAILALEKTLRLKAYSPNTIKVYKSKLVLFFYKFMDRDPKEISKAEIESYVYSLIEKHKISETSQNQLINAIKAYYEHVLGMPREYYDIKCPKRAERLPDVLTEEEVWSILNAPENLKHKAILWTIYSGGLRISELVRLRIADIRSAEGCIFVKGTKGKKDRKTVLSKALLPLLRAYYRAYQPSYWLFEGQTGGQYSVSSIRAIFRRAVKTANANPWATVHTLRHSFATHCIQNNVNMRHVQLMLGHSSPKTTELYTKLLAVDNKKIASPLDNIADFNNFATDSP